MRTAALVFTTALVFWMGTAPGAESQLSSRPAAEWVKVLDSPERLESLRVGEVVARLGIRPGQVVADLGAGTGPFVPAFAQAVGAKGKVYAVDVDDGFFPYIERRAKDSGVNNVQTVLGVFTDPKLPSADVDVAFFHDVVHHIENRDGYMKALVKYLKPSARIVIIDYHPAQSPHANEPALQVSKAQANAWLAPLGFKPVQDVSLFDEKWFVIYGR